MKVKLATTLQGVVLGVLLLSVSSSKIPNFEGEGPKVSTVLPQSAINDGLAVMADGTLLGSNYGQGSGTTLYRVNPVSKVVDSISNKLHGPLGVAVDANQKVWVSHGLALDTTSRVEQLDTKGQIISSTVVPGFTTGLAIDHRGNTYVGNYLEPTIYRISSNGELEEFAKDERLRGVAGVTFGATSDTLFVANFNTGQILTISPLGEVHAFAQIPDVLPNWAVGYITYLAGYVYATNISNHKIYRVAMDGTVSWFAGSGDQATVDGSLSSASFDLPNGITADRARKVLYISQGGKSHTLRSIVF